VVLVGKGAESSCRAGRTWKQEANQGVFPALIPRTATWWPPRNGGRRENAILFLARTSFATVVTVVPDGDGTIARRICGCTPWSPSAHSYPPGLIGLALLCL